MQDTKYRETFFHSMIILSFLVYEQILLLPDMTDFTLADGFAFYLPLPAKLEKSDYYTGLESPRNELYQKKGN